MKCNTVLVVICGIVLFLLSFFWISSANAQQKEHRHHTAVCSKQEEKGVARCHARVIVEDNSEIPFAAAAPAGYGPSDFLSAYNLNGLWGNTIIGIVDAYDHPNIASDLTTYSNQFHLAVLPVCLGTIASSKTPCFAKVDQHGGTNFPKKNSGWALETSLDTEIAHAICPSCKILLVEATSASLSDLIKAYDTAVRLGAGVISNSFGSSEFKEETKFDDHFNNPGVATTVSAGDSGFGTEYPASSRFVTAVGGTTLLLSANGSYKKETVWDGSGSGCSTYEKKPSWQKDSGCLKRTVADVSADADPTTGAAIYDSVTFKGKKGWFKIGGTSLAAPLIAGVYALSGKISSAKAANSLPYIQADSSNLHDIVSGSNGSCLVSYLCTGVKGYDGPSGMGTPNGVSAF